MEEALTIGKMAGFSVETGTKASNMATVNLKNQKNQALEEVFGSTAGESSGSIESRSSFPMS